MTETGHRCTAYFKGRDGLGTCDTNCQWWNDGCVCAKGHPKWDGIDREKKEDNPYLRGQRKDPHYLGELYIEGEWEPTPDY